MPSAYAWDGNVHNSITQWAADRITNLPSTYKQILVNNCNAPDIFDDVAPYVEGYSVPHSTKHSIIFNSVGNPIWGSAPAEASYNANLALLKRALGQTNDEYTQLSWACHYMEDVSQPMHTSLLAAAPVGIIPNGGQQYYPYHNKYEGDIVGANWVGGQQWRNSWQPSGTDGYLCIDPSINAYSMGYEANGYVNYLLYLMTYNSADACANDQTLKTITRQLIQDDVKHTQGMIENVSGY